MHEIKTVVFDVGRVLAKLTTKGDNFSRLMRALAVEPSEAFNTYWFTAELRQHMTGELDPRRFYGLAKEKFNLPHSYDDFVEGWCDMFEPMPGMQDIFDRLAGQYTLGLLSDTDPLHWAKISAMLPWLNKARPTLSYDVGYLKPHPLMFETAAKNCGREKHQCLFIDDKQEHVDGARFHGMPALLFQGPDKLIKDLTGLGIIQA